MSIASGNIHLSNKQLPKGPGGVPLNFSYIIFDLEMNLTAISRDFRYVMMAWYQALATCQETEKNPPPD